MRQPCWCSNVWFWASPGILNLLCGLTSSVSLFVTILGVLTEATIMETLYWCILHLFLFFFNMLLLLSISWCAVIAELTSLEAQPGSAEVPGKELSCHAHHPIITSLFPNSHNPLLKEAWMCCYGEVLYLLWGKFQPRYRPQIRAQKDVPRAQVYLGCESF